MLTSHFRRTIFSEETDVWFVLTWILRLFKTEVIDELAERAGVGAKVKKITEAAMRGEIDFNESFIQRVSLLKGLNENVMKEVAENLPITEGAERLMQTLNKIWL